MGFIGLDVLAVKALSRQLSGYAREVDALQKELTSLLQQTEWKGADQRRFAEEWGTTHRPGLVHGSELLDRASTLALDGARAKSKHLRRGDNA